MLASMLEKGKDAYLPAGTAFTAYLNGDVVLDRIALQGIQPAPVQRKGPATVTIFRTAETKMLGPHLFTAARLRWPSCRDPPI
jgi:hypothetical protein